MQVFPLLISNLCLRLAKQQVNFWLKVAEQQVNFWLRVAKQQVNLWLRVAKQQVKIWLRVDYYILTNSQVDRPNLEMFANFRS